MNQNSKSLVLPVLLLSACAGLTEDDNYERENALIMAREQFEAKKQSCTQAGGVIIMQTQVASRLRREFTHHDYELAQCLKW